MKIISTKVHGMLDYLVGIVLILFPWIWGLDPSSPEGMIFIILGVAALLYSLLTNYELGAAKILSMRTHLALDAASGIILAASPWLLGFHESVYLPHLVLGLFEIAAAALTETTPGTDRS